MTNNRKPVKVLPAACVSGTAISSMGMAAPPPVDSTAVPAPQPSQRIYLERGPVRGSTLPEFNSVSLSLCRLLILKHQGLCWFRSCCSLSSLEPIYKPMCLFVCFGSTGFYSFRGFRWKVERSNAAIWIWSEKHKKKKRPKYLNDGCIWNLHKGGVQHWHFQRGEITVDSREWRAACKNKLPHTSLLTEWLSHLKNLLRGK